MSSDRRPKAEVVAELLESEQKRFRTITELLSGTPQESTCRELIDKISDVFKKVYGKSQALVEQYRYWIEALKTGDTDVASVGKKVYEIAEQATSLLGDYYDGAMKNMQELEEALQKALQAGQIPKDQYADVIRRLEDEAKTVRDAFTMGSLS